MTTQHAKCIPLREILRRLGYDPTHQVRGEKWYFSPFRDEKNPSFKINERKNVWYDFAEGKGGNVLDLVRYRYNTTDVSSTLKQLDNIMGRAIVTPIAPKLPTSEVTSNPFQIQKVKSSYTCCLWDFSFIPKNCNEIHLTKECSCV